MKRTEISVETENHVAADGELQSSPQYTGVFRQRRVRRLECSTQETGVWRERDRYVSRWRTQFPGFTTKSSGLAANETGASSFSICLKVGDSRQLIPSSEFIEFDFGL
ncbi:hypothetical protein Bbelb_033650 [Branchiostoma belcheri]|nr:hypothetical protein Bbelb_033650 [Branchiostoma belcheri]